jgi:aryl carrier-like protein
LFRERFEDGCLLVNGLGATECGLVRQFVIHRTMPPAAGVVPVGYPVEDMEVRVLDEAGQPVPIGEVGEIAVQSRYLAVGYWGRPDLTAQAFTSDSEEPDLRTYRTGDLGRLGPDGRLDHLGRRDARQKIRGQWVDLAQVEAVLLSAAGVREAAARVHAPESDDPRLVGYVVPQDTPRPTVSTLRRHLAASLSDAMMPTAFVMLDRLPLTDNGKLDRAALPPPSPGRPRLDSEFVAPRTGLERLLADVWAEVLSVDPVGVHDAFLDLGGDSLRVGRVHARLQDRLGIAVPVSTLLEHATIAALARALGPGDASPDSLATVPARAQQQIAAVARLRNKKRRR